MSTIDSLTILKIIHVISVALLVGGAFFTQVILRWAARSIPAAQAATLMQKAGVAYTRVVVWPALSLLLLSGLLRLERVGLLPSLGDLSFNTSRYGRWLMIMIGGWLVMTAGTLIISLFMLPALKRRLDPKANPGPADVVERQDRMARLSKWVQWLSLAGLIAGLIALVAGSSLGIKGGLL